MFTSVGLGSTAISVAFSSLLLRARTPPGWRSPHRRCHVRVIQRSGLEVQHTCRWPVWPELTPAWEQAVADWTSARKEGRLYQIVVYAECRLGLPFPVVWYGRRLDGPHGISAVGTTGPPLRPYPASLPPRPMWGGAVADVLIWSVLALIVAKAANRIRAFYRQRKAERVGRCQQCGYDLRGCVSGRCSECGLPYDRHKFGAGAPESSRVAEAAQNEVTERPHAQPHER